MADDVRLVIYDGAIAAMSLPGGQTWRWARQRRSRVERLAKFYCPRRTGELQRSINGTYTPGPPNHIIMEVHADAAHAAWVHEGTHGPIYPRTGKYLRLAPGPLHPHYVYRRSVAGQRSQPFLSRALREVMADL